MPGARLPLRPLTAVQADWVGGLPKEKLEAFRRHTCDLETCYLMWSVALNEVFELRAHGQVTKAFEVLSLTPALCCRLTGYLENLLRRLAEHAKQYPTNTSVAALRPDDYRSPRAQRLARKACFMNYALPPARAQFLNKVRSLRTLVSVLSTDFSRVAEDLPLNGVGNPSAPEWDVLDAIHFDLNTCLREVIVVLKCFLRALPCERLYNFQAAVYSGSALACAAGTRSYERTLVAFRIPRAPQKSKPESNDWSKRTGEAGG